MEDYLKSEHYRRLCEAQDRLHEECRVAEEQAAKEAESRIYLAVGDTTKPEGARQRNLEGLTPEQRLVIANADVPCSRSPDVVELTLEERGGLSMAEFLALRPARRMEMLEVALHNRRENT